VTGARWSLEVFYARRQLIKTLKQNPFKQFDGFDPMGTASLGGLVT
jgi:hypothetical protein